MEKITEIILSNIYLSSAIVFISQVLFLYLRTKNVIYTTERNRKMAVITNILLSIVWFISVLIGLRSIEQGQFLPFLSFIVGSSIGTYYGISKKEE